MVRPSTSEHISLEFEPYGNLRFESSDDGWFGRLEGIVPCHAVEICIESDQNADSPSHNLERMREFITALDPLIERLFSYIHQKFLGNKWEKTLEEIREMYFLAAISLKMDGETFWVVLEPAFDVDSIFNSFIRFTVVKNEITWSNLSD